jgi:D-threo-aldose 1-dehydrogenase
MYAEVTDEGVAQLVDEAFRLGITYFDTAPLYGLGLSERRLGAALSGRPRESFTVSTKVGRLLRAGGPRDPVLSDGGKELFVGAPPLNPVFDFSYDGALRSLEESLERLGLDSVDIVYIHDPDDHLDEAGTGAYRAIARLRDEGVVKGIGAGMNDAGLLARLLRGHDLDCVLIAGRYTLLDQSALEELLPLCEERGTPVVLGGPFNSGILADAGDDAKYDYKAAPPEIVARTARLRAVCETHGVSLTAAAMQFPVVHPSIVTCLTGARSADELRSNAEAAAAPIPPALWDDMVRAGLLSPDAPVPS